MKYNQSAGFWLRLLSRLIDLIIVFILISITVYFSLKKVNEVYVFKKNWLFYIWSLSSSLFMLFFTTLVPIITRGKSIGNFLTKTKIISKQKFWKSIIYRELFFGLAWSFIIFSFTFLLSPRVLIEAITNANQQVNLNRLDEFKFAFLSTFAGVTIFAQFIFSISILVKKGGNSLIDSLSNSNVIRINKFVDTPKKEKQIIIKPRLIKNAPVNWLEGNDV